MMRRLIAHSRKSSLPRSLRVETPDCPDASRLMRPGQSVNSQRSADRAKTRLKRGSLAARLDAQEVTNEEIARAT